MTVPAKFNRAIFYNGMVFHSGALAHPELLTDDPSTGRLTVNAFFQTRLNAS